MSSNYDKIRTRVFSLLDSEGKSERYIYYGILVLIILYVMAIIVESVPSVKADPIMHESLNAFERFVLMVFGLEYILRVWGCTTSARWKSRWQYMKHPIHILDLLASIPLWFPFIGIDIRDNRLLRAIRVVRMIRLVKYIPCGNLITGAIYNVRKELAATLILLTIVFVAGSTMMYFIESPIQPDKFTSIPHTMWWAIVTMTTVGYGDLYPISAMGKIFGGIFAVLGIFTFVLPTAILGSSFYSELAKNSLQNSDSCGIDLSTKTD